MDATVMILRWFRWEVRVLRVLGKAKREGKRQRFGVRRRTRSNGLFQNDKAVAQKLLPGVTG